MPTGMHMKRLWADPAYRAKQIAALRRRSSGQPRVYIPKYGRKGSPELTAVLSALHTARWANPEFRAKSQEWIRQRMEHKSPRKRFWPVVDIGAPAECWPWTKPLSNMFYAHDRYWKPREYAWFETHGHTAAPVHTQANCHTYCCNPAHLLTRPAGVPSPKEDAAGARRAELAAEEAARSEARKPEPRFWRSIEKTADGCWMWTDEALEFEALATTYTPRRFAWEITNGPIPQGVSIGGTCGRPRCCNPEHSIAVGGNGGALRRKSVLTADDAEEIRRLYVMEDWSQNALSKKYGVPQSNISKIVNFKTFRGLSGARKKISAADIIARADAIINRGNVKLSEMRFINAAKRNSQP